MYKDLRQSQEYANYIDSIGWKVNMFDGVYYYIKRLLFWNFVKIQRPIKINSDKLINYLNKKYKHTTVYLEPGDQMQRSELLKYGFKKHNSPYLPTKTAQIDLGKSEELLLQRMHHKTRYNIKKFSKSNIKFSKSKDIQAFSVFWQSCARERGMFLDEKKKIVSLYKAFNNEAVIHVASDNSNWLAAILRISTKEISYYMYAAATNEGKKMFAPTTLAWEAITSAKNEGKKLFDFEGIYDERYPLDTWKGFSRFKKSFGGNEVEYPGMLWKIFI